MWKKRAFAVGAAGLLTLGTAGVAQAVPTGPPPYVVGMELDDALGTLAIADYQGVVSTRIGGGDECTVLSQSPTTRPPDFEDNFEGEFTILLGVRCGIEEGD